MEVHLEKEMSKIDKDKVYVVTSGDYSDYDIRAIFTTKELAEKYKQSFIKKDGYRSYFNDIEEYELDAYSEELKNGYKRFNVIMRKDGNTISVEPNDNYFEQINKISFFNNNIYILVIAKDENHAIKIVNEKRTQIIAMNKWGQNE